MRVDRLRKTLSLISASMIFAVTLHGAATASQAAQGNEAELPDVQSETSVLISYGEYLDKYAEGKIVGEKVSAELSQYSAAKPTELDGFTAVLIQQGSCADYSVTVKESGWYGVSFDYKLPPSENGVSAQLRIMLDGTPVCREAHTVVLRRIWEDSGKPEKDYSGNELQPDSAEKDDWQPYVLHDSEGMTDADIMLYLSKGNHTVSFMSLRETIALKNVVLGARDEYPSYSEKLDEYEKNGYKHAKSDYIAVRAEYPLCKSEQSLIMTSDYSSASTSPSDPSKTVLNVIGGEVWKFPGQKITWEIEVPDDALYRVCIKYRQDYKRSMKVYRTLYIDGKIPFEEMKTVTFEPTSKWKNYILSDISGEPYDFYLTAGKHTLSLDVTFSPVTGILGSLNNTVQNMNELYRRIFTITGTSVDTKRDYELDREIPELISTMERLIDELKNCGEELTKINGVKTAEASLIDVAADQLSQFVKKPSKIASGLENFKTNTSALADALLTIKEQPLLLDTVMLGGDETVYPSAKSGVFQSFIFQCKSFLSSFADKYSKETGSMGDEEPLEVWISSGRDQMLVLKQLIDNSFVPKSGIQVNLSLINDPTTLTQAIMGNSGPDCAVMVARGVPINYSMRNALVELSGLDGFSEVAEQFYPSAFIPYEYNGGIYALPETQVYQMIFYRTDIFAELGLTVPKTWDELYSIVTKIQRSNMQVGIPPESHQIFQTLLLQRGGTYYNEDKSAALFTTSASIDAFTQWTDFYNKYGFPLKYDAFNRFRTGEVPIVIQPYTFYCQLSVAAPEILGLWDMAPIPGTLDNDGNIDRAQTSDGSACIIINDGESADDEFEFLKWWVSADTQAAFAQKIENRLGESGRYTTANREAFYAIPWSVEQQKQLLTAWGDVSDIPMVPGSYYVDRNITNAFRSVVYNKLNPRETLLRYNKDMNNEITRKRQEFGLEK